MDCQAAQATTRLSFRNVIRPIELDNGSELLPILDSVFRYWPHEVLSDCGTDEPVITVTAGDRGRYWLHAPWLDEPVRYSNGVNLACGLGVNINQAFLAGPGEYLCLHAAAAEIGGRLVIFPSAYHAGKSTLTVCLAAAGARIFCDDILPVVRRTGLGMALGITPRLRLPWPTNLTERTSEFIEARKGAENRQYLYVNLEEHEQAPFGDTVPIGGVVLLNRSEDQPARLKRIGLGEALKHVVLRNFARKVPMDASLDRLHEILVSSYCARLTYSSADDAAELLMTCLPDWQLHDTPHHAAEPAGWPAIPDAKRGGQGRLGRCPGIRERLVDGELFLVDSSGQAIYHLNAVGTGLWRLLDGACDINEVTVILAEAFPDAGRERIERDVRGLIKDLLACGLLIDHAGRETPGRSVSDARVSARTE